MNKSKFHINPLEDWPKGEMTVLAVTNKEHVEIHSHTELLEATEPKSAERGDIRIGILVALLVAAPVFAWIFYIFFWLRK